jgi:hypothetical protein
MKFSVTIVFSKPPPESNCAPTLDLIYDAKAGTYYTNPQGSWISVPSLDSQQRGWHRLFPGLRLESHPTNAKIRPKWAYHSPQILEELLALKATHPDKWDIVYEVEVWRLQEIYHPNVENLYSYLLSSPLLPPYEVHRSQLSMFPGIVPTFDRALKSLPAIAKASTLETNDLTCVSPSVSPTEFVQHFLAPVGATRCLSFLGAPVTHVPTPQSLAQVNLLLPQPLRAQGFLRVEDGKAEFEACYAMPGAIADPHQDGYFAPHLIIHLGGIKRWFIWADTPENRAVMRRVNLTGLGSDCYASTLEGLKCLTNASVVEARAPLSYFIIPPGTFHAVVTIERAIHLTALFVHPKYFDQALSLLDSWTCEWKAANLSNDPIKSPTNCELAGSIAIGEMGDTAVTWARYLKEHSRPDAVDWARFAASLSK